MHLEDLNLVVPWRCGEPSIGSFSAFLAPVHPFEGSGNGLEEHKSISHKYPVTLAPNPDNVGTAICHALSCRWEFLELWGWKMEEKS